MHISPSSVSKIIQGCFDEGRLRLVFSRDGLSPEQLESLNDLVTGTADLKRRLAALEKDPAFVQALYDSACCYARTGDKDQAVEYLTRLQDMASTHKDALEKLLQEPNDLLLVLEVRPPLLLHAGLVLIAGPPLLHWEVTLSLALIQVLAAGHNKKGGRKNPAPGESYNPSRAIVGLDRTA